MAPGSTLALQLSSMWLEQVRFGMQNATGFPEESAKVAVLGLAPKTFLFQHASLLRSSLHHSVAP